MHAFKDGRILHEAERELIKVPRFSICLNVRLLLFFIVDGNGYCCESETCAVVGGRLYVVIFIILHHLRFTGLIKHNDAQLRRYRAGQGQKWWARTLFLLK